MIVTIKAKPTTDGLDPLDIGYLLWKNPTTFHTREHNGVYSHTWFEKPTDGSAVFNFLVQTDPIETVKSRQTKLDAFVSPEAYCVGSIFATAFNKAMRSALTGKIPEGREDLVSEIWDFEVEFPSIRIQDADPKVLADVWIGTGLSTEFTLENPTRFTYHGRMTGRMTLRDLCERILVLAPIFFGARHFVPGKEDFERLRNHPWLEEHPMLPFILTRLFPRESLKRFPKLFPNISDDEEEEPVIDTKPRFCADSSLAEARYAFALNELIDPTVAVRSKCRLLDLGSSTGKFAEFCRKNGIRTEIALADVSSRPLMTARRFLRKYPEPTEYILGGLGYNRDEFARYPYVACLEVIEHLQPVTVLPFIRDFLARNKPIRMVLTTPNRGYNSYMGIDSDKFRHWDHQFELYRNELEELLHGIPSRYRVEVFGVGTGIRDLESDRRVHECTDRASYDPTYQYPSHVVVLTRKVRWWPF